VAGAAVFVVLLAIITGRAAWSKPNAGARFGALLSVIIVCWLILAAGCPSGAGALASDTAQGVMALAAGLGKVISAL
jgi:hypothetical protein